MRISRQTELSAKFPIHVVCEWLGNSRLIAKEHYLRATEDDFRAAVEKATYLTTQQATASARIVRARRI
jgi:hypothetical protein